MELFNVKSIKKIRIINRDMNAPFNYNSNKKFDSQVIFKCHNAHLTLSRSDFHRVGVATEKYLNVISFVLTVGIDKNSMHFINHGNSMIRLNTHPSSCHLLKEKTNILVIAS